jgi:hypothetical protein
VIATSSAENRTPRADGTTIDDTRKIDRKGGSCGPQVIQPVLCHGYAHPAMAPPPASRPYALLPGLFTQSPWGVSHPTFGGLPASSPNPLLLTSLPLCPSSRLSCSSMPFLQRYSTAAVLDADLQLPEQSEAAVSVTFGILGWQSMQLRPILAPCPARSPPWTPKWCFWSLGPVAGQLFVLPFASPQVNIGTQIDGRRGRHA